MVKVYRESYNLFAVQGWLFNHESERRGEEFVTRKIANTVAKIALGLEDKLVLGNLDAKRDWGYAPDYVESMWHILNQPEPDDYVVATNETHSVREFIQAAFEIPGLDWERYVTVDKKFLRPLDVNYLRGDYTKAKEKLGWEPKVKFKELVQIMVDADIDRWRSWQAGERFPFLRMFAPRSMVCYLSIPGIYPGLVNIVVQAEHWISFGRDDALMNRPVLMIWNPFPCQLSLFWDSR